MKLRIFISHSFDHPDKLLRVLEFLRKRGVQHIDHSVPVWDQLNDDDPQSEIERRIRKCDRVLVILTANSHKSDWINQEVAWARQHHRPVIGIWPHGEAGSPIPREVLDANAHLIGWRATSLEKAMNLEDVGDYRALDLAEDADFDLAVRRVVEAAGAISLLLIGGQVGQLLELQGVLKARGVNVDLFDDPLEMLGNTAIGGLVGFAGGMFVGELLGKTSSQAEQMALRGAVLGASLGSNVYMRGQVRRIQSLMTIDLVPTEPST